MNQRAIAAKLGLGQATVSRALQGSTLVTEKTRRLVQEEARKQGYKANPLVATLMEHIRSGRKIHERGTIAVLHDAASPQDRMFDFYTFKQLTMDRASTDHLQNISMAFSRLTGMGYERIGMILPGRAIAVPNNEMFLSSNPWLGGFHQCQYYLPFTPRLVLVQGTWIPGETLPSQKPAKRHLISGKFKIASSEQMVGRRSISAQKKARSSTKMNSTRKGQPT